LDMASPRGMRRKPHNGRPSARWRAAPPRLARPEHILEVGRNGAGFKRGLALINV